jgi:PAS domain S-box-containing protein
MNDHKKPQRDTGFTLRDLIDLEQLRDLFARFTGIAGFPVVLVAYPDQELLIGNGRWDICAQFRHRPPNPSAPCQLDDPTFATGLKSTSDVQIQQCVCGLISGAVSVLVDGRALATLFSGQVLLSPPDWQQLKQRGAISGYDPAAYLAALPAAPIVTEAQLKKGLTYLRDMSAALAEQGLARLDSLQMMHLAAENEKRYRLLAENTTDVIWTMDLNLNSTYTSPSVTRLRGYDAATAMNQSLAETLSPDSLVIVNRALREELAREALPQKDLSRFRVLQLEILHKDGHIIPIETTVTFLRDDFGRPVEILGVTRDISARKQAEAAILKSKERAQRQRNALVALAFDPAIANGDQLRAAQNLAQAAADALKVPRVSVWLLAQNGTEMRCIEQYDALTQEHSPGTTLSSQDYPTYWRIMRQDNLISVEDAQYDRYTNELDDDYLSPLGITSMLDAGIQVDGELVGVICLEHIGPKRVWQADEQVFANTIAGLMAQTLINARRKWVEEQLRQAQETYRGLLDSTTELIYVQDEQGVILDVNKTVSAVYDIPRQEIIGQKPEFLAAPGKNDLAKLAEQHRLAFLGKPQTLEFWGRKRNGAIFPKEVILAPSTYFGQKVVIAVARDISKNKQAEELLKRSKANLNAILENPLESVWSIDTEYKIQYVNKSFSQMFYQCFGVSLVTGMSLLEYLPAATRDRWKAQAERAFHNEHLVFQDKFDAGESPIYIEVAVNPIKIDGRIVGASFYSRDITTQTLTNQQIQYETELRKLLIELSTDFINLPLDQLAESIQRSMADLGQFVDVDRVYLFAYDFAAHVAINTYEWCAPGIKPEIDNLQSVPMTNYPEWLEQHQKGNPVWIPDVDALPDKNPDGVWGILKAQNIKSLITIPMLGNGRLLGFVGFDSVRQQHHYTDYERQLLQLYAQMLVNVMERIETEEQMKKAQEDVARLQKLESVGTLAGGIAHDFNNLLTGLFSNLNLAQRHLRPDHPARSLWPGQNRR